MIKHRFRAHWPLAAMAGLLVAAQAASAASPSDGIREGTVPSARAQAALQTLLATGSAQATPAASVPITVEKIASGGPAAAPGGRRVVSLPKGQSLDTFIRQQLPDSPLKIEVLRDAIRRLNPQAFNPGTYRLLPGSQLVVPTREDLIGHAFGPHPVHQSLAEAQDAAAAAAQAQAASARRGWVRYP